MEISQSSLAYMLLWSLLLGIGLGAVYDAIRIIRVFLTLGESEGGIFIRSAVRKLKLPLIDKEKMIKRLEKKKKRILRELLFFFLDLLYALFCGCAFILLEYYANDGTPRAFSLFGVIAGFLIYYFSLGRLVYALSERIVLVLRVVIAYLELPFEYLGRSIRGLYAKVKSRRLYRQEEKRARDFDKKRREELLSMARMAFLELEDK